MTASETNPRLRNVVGGNINFATSEVRSGKIVIGGVEYSVALVRSNKVPDGHFLVANVRANGKTIWNFRDERFDGIMVLMKIQNKHYICFVSRDRQVKKIVPIEDIANSGAEKYSADEEIKELVMKELGMRK